MVALASIEPASGILRERRTLPETLTLLPDANAAGRAATAAAATRVREGDARAHRPCAGERSLDVEEASADAAAAASDAVATRRAAAASAAHVRKGEGARVPGERGLEEKGGCCRRC